MLFTKTAADGEHASNTTVSNWQAGESSRTAMDALGERVKADFCRRLSVPAEELDRIRVVPARLPANVFAQYNPKISTPKNMIIEVNEQYASVYAGTNEIATGLARMRRGYSVSGAEEMAQRNEEMETRAWYELYHEYVHALRDGYGLLRYGEYKQNLAHQFVEEAVACFISSMFSDMPRIADHIMALEEDNTIGKSVKMGYITGYYAAFVTKMMKEDAKGTLKLLLHGGDKSVMDSLKSIIDEGNYYVNREIKDYYERKLLLSEGKRCTENLDFVSDVLRRTAAGAYA